MPFYGGTLSQREDARRDEMGRQAEQDRDRERNAGIQGGSMVGIQRYCSCGAAWVLGCPCCDLPQCRACGVQRGAPPAPEAEDTAAWPTGEIDF